MAGTVNVKLVARDEATPVFTKFSSNAKSSLDKVTAASTKSSSSVNTSLAGLSTSFLKVTAAIAGLGVGVTALRKIGTAITGSAVTLLDYETALVRINTLNKEGLNIGEVSKRLKGFDASMGTSTELANGLFETLTRGANVDQAFDILEASAKAAIGQFADLKETVALVNQIMAAYESQSLKAIQVTDALVAVTNTGAVTFSSLIPAMGQVIGVASSVGVTIHDTANAIGQMAIVTGSANLAATGFKNILNQAIKRSDEFAKAGINVNETLRGPDGFVSLMRQVRDAVESGSIELKDLFTNIRAVNGASIASGDLFDKLTSSLETVKDSAGKTDANFAKVTNTLSQGLKNIGNAFANVLVEIAGDDFGNLRDVLFGVEEAVKGLANEAPAIREFFATIVESAKASIPAVTALIKTVGILASVFNDVVSVFTPEPMEDWTKATRQAATDTQYFSDELNDLIAGTDELTSSVKKTVTPLGKASDEMDNLQTASQKVAPNLYEVSKSSIDAGKSAETLSKSTEMGTKAVVANNKETTRLVMTLADGSRSFDLASAKGDNFTKVISTITSAVKVSSVTFKKFFGETQSAFVNIGNDAIKAFAAIRADGTASPRAIAEAFRAEFEKIAKVLGPNATVVKEMRLMLDTLERDAGITNSRLQDIFAEIGVSISLPVKDAPDKYKQAFNEMIASGEFTRKELSKIFIDQIRPKLLESTQGVPQAWDANFGAMSSSAVQLKETVERNMASISTSVKTTAQEIQAAFESSFEGSSVAATKFHGTWLEQQQIRDQLAGKPPEKSLFQDFGTGTTDTTNNFGQSEGNQSNRPFGSGEEVSGLGTGDRQKLLNELALLDSTLPETRGQFWIDQRRKLIAELTALDNAALKQQIDAQKQLEAQRMAFINGNKTPQTARGVDVNSGSGFIAGSGANVATNTAIARFTPEESLLKIAQGLSNSVGASTGFEQASNQNTQAISSNSGSIENNTSVNSSLITAANANKSALNQNTAQLNLLGQSTLRAGVSSFGGTGTFREANATTHSPSQSTGLTSGFANGGLVQETGLHQLEKGERILTTQQQAANERGNFAPQAGGGGVSFSGRGTTGIITQGGGSTSQSLFSPMSGGQAPMMNPDLARMFAQGRSEDVLGHQAQRQIAKAIIPATRQAVRRRDITADITRNTPLTQQGTATTK